MTTNPSNVIPCEVPGHDHRGLAEAAKAHGWLDPGEADLLRAELVAMTELHDAKHRDWQRVRHDYDSACSLVAGMHAAAVGEVRGPIRGVVEDVEDLRISAAELKERVLALAPPVVATPPVVVVTTFELASVLEGRMLHFTDSTGRKVAVRLATPDELLASHARAAAGFGLAASMTRAQAISLTTPVGS